MGSTHLVAPYIQKQGRNSKKVVLRRPHICHLNCTGILCGSNILHPNALFVTKLNLRQNNINRSNPLCKTIHWGKIPIYCVKSPIQCKITCCKQNCTLNACSHHENHTLACTFSVNYTTFVKYMDHFHVQSRKFYTWQKNLHRHRLWQIWDMRKLSLTQSAREGNTY